MTNSWRLTALEADTGTERWTTETAGNRAPVVADGVVYASGPDAVEAHDGADGEPLWRYRSDASSASGDPIAPVVGGAVFSPSAGLQRAPRDGRIVLRLPARGDASGIRSARGRDRPPRSLPLVEAKGP